MIPSIAPVALPTSNLMPIQQANSQQGQITPRAVEQASNTPAILPRQRGPGQNPSQAEQGEAQPTTGNQRNAANASNSERASDAESSRASTDSADGDELSPQEQRQLQELKATDQRVRSHEQAHQSAAAGLSTSGPSYEYQKGPDGKRYAVGGEVNIDTSREDTPEATLQKAQQIRRAALAPADPSSTDRRVAAQASRMEQAARQELMQQRLAEANGEESSSGNSPLNTFITIDSLKQDNLVDKVIDEMV